MKNRLRSLFVFAFSLAAAGVACAQGTAFTYQGRLNDGASPATGIYDLRFAICGALASGSQIGGTLTNANTAVSNGPNAQILSSPPRGGAERKFYFEDLPPELQKVLRAQLRQAGDVSAVIETPDGFMLYVTKEKTAEALSVATLSIPKRSYEQWLNEQSEGTK